MRSRSRRSPSPLFFLRQPRPSRAARGGAACTPAIRSRRRRSRSGAATPRSPARSPTRPARASPRRRSRSSSSKSNDGFFATTKKNGEFSAKDIKAGEWRLQVEAPNFITVRQPLTIAASKNPPLNVTLKRDNSPELLTKAEALFKAGQNAEARTEYMTVLAAHPELTAINRAIAFTYGRGEEPRRGAEVSRPGAGVEPRTTRSCSSSPRRAPSRSATIRARWPTWRRSTTPC